MKQELKYTMITGGPVAYRKRGDSPDANLVFIHGALADSRLFHHQLRAFSERAVTIAIDLPGHGRSVEWDHVSLDSMIEAVHAVVSEEHLLSCIVIGHSMGGGVCLELFKRGMPGLQAMVLVSSGPVLTVPAELIRAAHEDDREGLVTLMVDTIYSKHGDLLRQLALRNGQLPSRNIVLDDIEICQGMDYTQVLPEIDIPVQVLANREDRVVPWSLTASMEELIPDAELVIFEVLGHVPFLEYPDTFNRVVQRFVDDVIAR